MTNLRRDPERLLALEAAVALGFPSADAVLAMKIPSSTLRELVELSKDIAG
jgi:hypothetical protein